MSENNTEQSDDNLESYLLGLAYLQSFTNRDFEEAQFIDEHTTDDKLKSGLLLVSSIMLKSLAENLNTDEEQLIISMRETIIASNA